jgi:thioesterase domain-containing protein/acyl carrier protein
MRRCTRLRCMCKLSRAPTVSSPQALSQHREASPDARGISVSAPQEPFPLTAPQAAIWLDQALHPNSPIYNTGQILSFVAAIDTAKFEAALHRVISEHDSLRLRFVQRGAKVLQHVVSDAESALDVRDFSAEAAPDEAANAWLRQIFWQPVAPTDFPLFKFALAKVSAQRFLWLQRYHHLIIDAAGRELIAARVAAVYDALCAGVDPRAVEAESYRAAQAAENVYLSSETYASDETYWTARLANLPPSIVRVPSQLSEKLRSGRSAQIDCGLTDEESAALRRFARNHGSSAFKVIAILAWCCFNRLYQIDDITFAVPLSGRNGTKRSTAGLLAKVMPFRLRLDQSASLRSTMAVVDEQFSEDLRHQSFPADHISRALRLRDRNRVGLYDVGLNYVRSNYTFTLGGSAVACSTIATGFSLPWSVSATDTGATGSIRLLLKFDQGRIAQEVADKAGRCLRSLLTTADRLLDVKIADVAAELDPLPASADAHEVGGRGKITADPKPQDTGGAAGDAIEKRLLGIWQRNLNAPDIGLHDNYFAVGGDSLRAVLLLGECNEQLGVNLPLSALFESPTVSAMAALVRAHRPSTRSSHLVCLRRGDGTPALLLIHPIGGSVLCYADLVASLEINSPIYGIESSALQSDDPGSLEDIARDYLDLAAEVRGDRPIHLAGWSLGGLIAVEMARQLARMRQPAASVTLIDTAASRTADVDHDEAAISRVAAAGLAQPSPGSADGSAISPKQSERIRRLIHNARRLRERYRPEPASMSLTLIRAALEPGVRHEEFDWSGSIRGPIDVIALPATHDSIIRPPHVAIVAGAIARNMLGNAQTR